MLSSNVLGLNVGVQVAIVTVVGSVLVALIGLGGNWYKRSADRAAENAAITSADVAKSSAFVAEFKVYAETLSRENHELRQRTENCEKERDLLRGDVNHMQTRVQHLEQLEREVADLRATVNTITENRNEPGPRAT